MSDIRKFFKKAGPPSGSATAPASADATRPPPAPPGATPSKVQEAPPPAKASSGAAAKTPPTKQSANKSKFFTADGPSPPGASPSKPQQPQGPHVAGGGGAAGSGSRALAGGAKRPRSSKAPPARKGGGDEDDDSDVQILSSDDDEEEDVRMSELEDDESDSGSEQLDTDSDSEGGDAGRSKKKAKVSGAAAPPVAKPAPSAKRSRVVVLDDSDEDGGDGGGVPVQPAPAVAAASTPKSPAGIKIGGRVLPAGLAAAAAAPAAPAPAPSLPPSARKPPSATPASKSPAKPRSAKKAKPSLDPEVAAAVAVVDAAAAQLPPEEEVGFSFLPEGQSGGGNDAVPPPNLGNKEVPRGHPDCLTGKTFVVTGVLDSLYRSDAEDLVKRHSGRVTGNVSSKTTFLVMGQNCGRSKYNQAKHHGTKIINEDGLFALIKATQHLVQAAPAPLPASQPPPRASAAGLSSPAGPQVLTALEALNQPRLGAASGSSTQIPRPLSGGAAAARPSQQPSGVPAAGPVPSAAGDQLWVDKYKPKSSAELVGNPGNIKTLVAWLRGWEEVQLRHGKPLTVPGPGKPKDLTKKAVLLAGPPGIGKTSAAHILAKEAGYTVVEMNASDTRNKSDNKASTGMAGKASNQVREMATNTSLLFTAGPGGQLGTTAQRQVLVMDEVDGMSAGDRGGVADLIATIRKAKIPIICIANDKYNQKLKSLRNVCLELDWHKPTEDQVVKRLAGIAVAEGLKVNDSTLKELARGAACDMRLVLGQLQLVRLRAVALTYDDVKGKLGTSKDADMNPFDCGRKLLDGSAARMTLGERMELYFADSDLVPLLVQENYVNHKPVVAQSDADRMRALAKAADGISVGDTINSTLRRTNNWSLATATAVVGTLLPAAYMTGPREALNPGEMNFGRFSAWFGNYSTGNKQRRLLGEMTTTLAASGHVPLNRATVRLDYLPALRHVLTVPLRTQAEAGIPDTLHLMQEYCISRDQFDYVLDVTKFKSGAPWATDPMSAVETRTKSAFTRRFNQEGLVARVSTMLDEAGFKKGRGRGRAKAAAVVDEEEELDEGEARDVKREEEESEEEDEAALQRRLAADGVRFTAAAPAGKGGKGRASGGRASGSSSGRGSGRGRNSGGPSSGGRGGRGGRGVKK